MLAIQILRDRAKLMPHDVAKLLRLNRCTVSTWFNDRAQPSHLLGAKFSKLVDAVSSAVEAGDLPVPKTVKRGERAAYINATIARQLAKARL